MQAPLAQGMAEQRMFMVGDEPIKIVLRDGALEISKPLRLKHTYVFFVEIAPKFGWQKYWVSRVELADHVPAGRCGRLHDR